LYDCQQVLGSRSQEEKARQRAFNAALSAHKDLLSALKHLSGRRLPLAGVHCDLNSAMDALRAVETKVTQAIQCIEPHVP
jgi:hypothetical protein